MHTGAYKTAKRAAPEESERESVFLVTQEQHEHFHLFVREMLVDKQQTLKKAELCGMGGRGHCSVHEFVPADSDMHVCAMRVVLVADRDCANDEGVTEAVQHRWLLDDEDRVHEVQNISGVEHSECASGADEYSLSCV